MDNSLRNIERQALAGEVNREALHQARGRAGLCAACGINPNPNPEKLGTCQTCDTHLISFFVDNPIDSMTSEMRAQVSGFCLDWSIRGFNAPQPKNQPPKWIDDTSYANHQGADPHGDEWED